MIYHDLAPLESVGPPTLENQNPGIHRDCSPEIPGELIPRKMMRFAITIKFTENSAVLRRNLAGVTAEAESKDFLLRGQSGF